MSFEDLDVWKRSARLSATLYQQTKDLRDFGFRDQLTRSGLSIPSNIAEGYERDSDAEISRFLTIAKGSAGELRTQILIGIEAGYLNRTDALIWADEAKQLGRMLGALIKDTGTNSERRVASREGEYPPCDFSPLASRQSSLNLQLATMRSLIALITGITGQDGSYLTELLLEKGYEVHGIVRRSSTLERSRLNRFYGDEDVYEKRLFLHYADLSDTTTIRRIITKVQPTEFYHLAGQSHVGLSFEIPESTCDLTAMGSLRIMEILRDLANPPRFLHASSREIFGTPTVSPQDETTPINPNSPYGCAKAFATQMTKIYREAHGLFFCNAICYNHESPRRGENFVTRKITLAAARIKAGLQKSVRLGDLDAARDWGYAKDFVHAMWLMLQQPNADDYVLATGQSRTVRDLLQTAFDSVSLDWQKYVRIDDRFKRPADASELLGNPAKAIRQLDWNPSVTFEQLIQLMVDADQKAVIRH